MKETIESDSLKIEHLLNTIKEQGVEYLNSITERKTSVDNKLIPEKQTLPEEGYGTEEALKLFNKRFEPLMVASSDQGIWDL